VDHICGCPSFIQQNLVCDKIIIAYSISNSKPRLEFAIIEINCLVSKSKYEIICFGIFPTNMSGDFIGQGKANLFIEERR
jgi:hypothetical protein